MPNANLHWPLTLSILAALVTFGMKSAAYLLTGSVGLLSDAAESLVNLAAAVTAFFCLWISQKPVDRSHTYGHEKIEYFSSGIEGTLILFAALGIAWAAIERLLNPSALHELGPGLAVSLAAAGVNFAVAQVLLRTGRKHQSIVLEADGQHLMTDVWTSIAVLVGLGLVWLTGWDILDPFLALLVAANIVWTAFDLMRRSVDGLMDHALPTEEQDQLRQAIDKELPPGCHYHAMRTRRAGARRFVDFHLLVPGDWSVQKAHDLSDRIEAALQGVYPGMEATIHIEPLEATASWQDSELLPLEKAP